TSASSTTPGRHPREVVPDAAWTSVTVIINRLLFAVRRSTGAPWANVRIGALRWDCGTLPMASSERTVARDQAGGIVCMGLPEWLEVGAHGATVVLATWLGL